MTTFKLRQLERTDAQALLAFEIANRAWFESRIEARDPAFYSPRGVADHIEGCLADLAIGAWHPFVIEGADEGIVGRANLKHIDRAEGCAEVGYRVGQQFCGQGLATLALQHLIQQAQARWGLGQLTAQVYESNIASRRVLERCGFVPAPERKEGEPKGEARFVLWL